MPYRIEEARTTKSLRQFLKFPYRFYQPDHHWVPPLLREQKQWILHKNTPLFSDNPHAFFLCKTGKRVVGRVAVAEDRSLRQKRDRNIAYFTFLEGENDSEIFRQLMAAVEEWARQRGLDGVQGPVSPTKGDDFRGLMILGFHKTPVLMDSYNPRYYQHHLEDLGYRKKIDLFAYYYDLHKIDFTRRMKVLQYAQKRYGFQIDRFNKQQLEKEARDIKTIIDTAMPPDWTDLVPPPLEEILEMAQRLKRFADPDLVLIARDESGQPIGFNVALPDYNSVFRHLNGRLGPIGMCKYLYYRRKIRGGRSFIMFVVPEYRKKGVAQGLYLTALRNGFNKGYTYGEGSTIGEENIPMRRDAEKIGGRHYKSYRIYYKSLS